MPTADDPSSTDSGGEVRPGAGLAGAEPGVDLPDSHRGGRRLIRGWVQILLSLGLTVLVVILLLPQLAGEEQSVSTLRGLSIPLAATALALEAAPWCATA